MITVLPELPGSERQPPEADAQGRYANESKEMLGLAFVAAVQASAAGQPGHGSFDDPTVAAEPGGGLDSLAGDAVAYAA